MRILYLDIDTLRPDHLGCYGYHRKTSPNIDLIARDAAVYSNYYCSDAPCLPSRTALMTGRFGIHTGVVGHGGSAADNRLEGAGRDFAGRLGRESLPALIRRQGIRPTSISPFPDRHGAWAFNAGFSEVHDTGMGGMESAEHITPTVMKWISNNAEEDNWFLHVNYWDPHTPYRAPAEFGNPFKSDPLPAWPTEKVLGRHKELVGPSRPGNINMYGNDTSPEWRRYPGRLDSMADLRTMIDGYDCGIRYMDDHVGRILEEFDKRGLLEDMIIIVSSDHGENMGELGIYGEHGTADVATHRIPLIVRWPGKTTGHVDSALHYNLDLAPTLAELLGGDAIPNWDGESFAPSLAGETVGRREHLILSQCCHVCQRSVRFDKWLYIRTYHDGYHPFPTDMLFNLDVDPNEEENVAGDHRHILHEAVYRLNEWHDQMMAGMQCETDPLWTVMREGGPYHARGELAGFCEYLERNGRGDATEELRRRHPQEFHGLSWGRL